MKFRIFKTESYDEDYKKLDHSEKLRVDNIINDLFSVGDVTGKPISYKFFREKKFNGKRLLYLVYKSLNVILLLAITNKKIQQATINEILIHLDEYKEYVIEKLRDFTS